MRENGKKWSVGELADWISSYFSENGIEDARLEAEYLLAYVMKCRRLDLALRKDKAVPQIQLTSLKKHVLKRRERVPLAYILGEQEFMGLKFIVNPSTLIPRPETEILVEEVLNLLKTRPGKTLVELGTGSGNISVSVAKMADVGVVYATDISEDALRIAQENIFRHGVASKVILRHGNLFEALQKDALEKSVDLLISNPPYVAQDEFPGLQPELRHEPVQALDGGPDGLYFYKQIAANSSRYLKKGGYAVVELNSRKSGEIRDIFESSSFEVCSLIKDYSGLDRILTLKSLN